MNGKSAFLVAVKRVKLCSHSGATALVGAIVVASLVLNVFTYIRMRDTPKKEKVPLSTSRSPLTPYTTLTSTNRIETTSYAIETTSYGNVDNVFCPNVGNANRTKEWKDAANTLLFGLDESVDPCEDFYGFTCNKFIERIDLDELGRGRFTTFSQAQLEVNSDIVKALEKVDVNDEKFSQTERITKAVRDNIDYWGTDKTKAFQSCVEHTLKDDRKASVNELLQYIRDRFGGIPFLGQRVKGGCELFRELGRVEQERALPTFMYTWVNVDHKNVSRNSYYISQPTLPMPREFYVLPQFAPELDARTKAIENVMKAFASDVLKDPSKYEKTIKDVIVTNPAYISFLNTLLSQTDLQLSQEPFVNYIIVHMLFEDAEHLGDKYLRIVKDADYVTYAQRKGVGISRSGRKYSRVYDERTDARMKCVDTITTYMPYGTGYVYVKSREDRDQVVEDVKQQTELIMKAFLEKMLSTLTWMKGESYQRAEKKIKEMHRNYGWPKELFGDFKNFDTIDAYHRKDYYPILEAYNNKTDKSTAFYTTIDAYHRKDYYPILEAYNNKTDKSTAFYTILNLLRQGYENREAFRRKNETADRTNFLESPASVNAWYAPELNSLTLPFGILTSPHYNLQFPKAFNFAGSGTVGGHELVHGFDDEGVQFDYDGSLANCSVYECGWLEQKGRNGFRDMAQCVVTQYNAQCCPAKEGNVHCANGAHTQGENIADLGGLQASYNAYKEYIKLKGAEEMRLPGLEKFTPNQIFWISYGYSWCAKETQSSLVKRLLTNPHSPNSCRVNQVLQDIPSFAKDFQCALGQKMYPPAEQRCKVWVA
ncbi:unnamed protein product [Haemonchus placei]|uniref:Peptidase_M13 domain-containing protein n=1 Tax=Haemonchus placei TaxID=6290 RepID=A0A0N4WWE5_HAEPC|nr:unnamed protein product [Haemonchus placei]